MVTQAIVNNHTSTYIKFIPIMQHINDDTEKEYCTNNMIIAYITIRFSLIQNEIDSFNKLQLNH